MSRYGFQIGQGMFMASNFTVLTVTNSVQALVGFGAATIRAMLTVEGSSGRYRYDGIAPTNSTGHMINSGDVVQILGVNNLQNFQVISTGGTTTLMVTYESAART